MIRIRIELGLKPKTARIDAQSIFDWNFLEGKPKKKPSWLERKRKEFSDWFYMRNIPKPLYLSRADLLPLERPQERKLQKCIWCKEWFNTTPDIMNLHQNRCKAQPTLVLCGSTLLNGSVRFESLSASAIKTSTADTVQQSLDDIYARLDKLLPRPMVVKSLDEVPESFKVAGCFLQIADGVHNPMYIHNGIEFVPLYDGRRRCKHCGSVVEELHIDEEGFIHEKAAAQEKPQEESSCDAQATSPSIECNGTAVSTEPVTVA